MPVIFDKAMDTLSLCDISLRRLQFLVIIHVLLF